MRRVLATGVRRHVESSRLDVHEVHALAAEFGITVSSLNDDLTRATEAVIAVKLASVSYTATVSLKYMKLVTRSPEVHVHGLFEVHKGPWFPSRSRGDGDGNASSLPSSLYPGLVSLNRSVSSKELPATTDGEWRRRHSLQSHKGGPEDYTF